MVPEKLSILFGLSMLASYIYTIKTSQPILLRRLADSKYRSYLNNETCTYIGKQGGHFHWTLATVDSYLAPNSYTYALLWMGSCAFARPYRLFSGILLFGISLFASFLVKFDGSFEAGSVWCWTAMILFVYIALQPYVSPIQTDECAVTTKRMRGALDKKPFIYCFSSTKTTQRPIKISPVYKKWHSYNFS